MVGVPRLPEQPGTARLNERMTRSRCFRRPVARELLYFRDGEGTDDAEWLLDLAPDRRSSDPRPAKTLDLQVAGLAEAAWMAYLQDVQAATRSDLQMLLCASVPDYAHGAEAAPRVTYS